MDFLGLDLAVPLTKLYGALPSKVSLEQLTGDASTRTYYRLDAPGRDPRQVVVMHLPENALGSDEGESGPGATELPFVAVQRLLAHRGVRVPRIYVEDLPRRVLLLEDLGDHTFEDRLASTSAASHDSLYEEVVDKLVSVHAATEAPEPDHFVFQRGFDASLLRWELDHFREWGLEAIGGPLPAAARRALDQILSRWTNRIVDLPQRLVHRDFQSRNLMWHEGEWVVIDFQDALMGPTVYDLVALLCDSYVDIPQARQEAMVARYAEARGIAPEPLLHEFWVVTVQRKLKDAGRFVFIDRVRGNPRFLQWYPRSLAYVGRALNALRNTVKEASDLRDVLEEQVAGFPASVLTPPSIAR